MIKIIITTFFRKTRSPSFWPSELLWPRRVQKRQDNLSCFWLRKCGRNNLLAGTFSPPHNAKKDYTILVFNNQNKSRNKTPTHSFHNNNRWNIFRHLLRTVREHGNPGRVQLIQMTIKHIKTVVTHLGLNNGVLGVPIRTSWGRTYSVSWRRVWQGWTGCSSVPIHFFQFRLPQPETKMRS